jgi:hypothetical protein
VSGTEFAFLALGLVLGATAGAAVGFVYRSRPPSREVRLTVTHDAVPRRAATLSSEALVARPGEPAPGGPADRRQSDERLDHGGVDRRGGGGVTAAPPAPVGGHGGVESRTPVRSGPAPGPGSRPATGSAVAVAIHPEVDTSLEALRNRPHRPLHERILRGEHRAMLQAIDAMAGEDGAMRRTWEALLTGLVEALDDRAIDLGYLDFPMGAPFWDTFTLEQCRTIASTLDSMGYRYDGRDGWVDGRTPAYRDLSTAVAAAGFQPRRVRAWPNSMEIGELYRGVRPAPEDAIAHVAPTLDAHALRELLGVRASRFEELWLVWEPIRRVLLEVEPAATPM